MPVEILSTSLTQYVNNIVMNGYWVPAINSRKKVFSIYQCCNFIELATCWWKWSNEMDLHWAYKIFDYRPIENTYTTQNELFNRQLKANKQNVNRTTHSVCNDFHPESFGAFNQFQFEVQFWLYSHTFSYTLNIANRHSWILYKFTHQLNSTKNIIKLTI